MTHIVKQVVEVPLEEFEILKDNNRKILSALENIQAIERPEYLTPKEFMRQTKLSWWKFNDLRSKNKLKVIQRGRKLYVPANEVTKYFNGEMED